MGVRSDGFRQIVRAHPAFVDKWLKPLERGDQVQWDLAEFYRALAKGMGDTDPDRAADVVMKLHCNPRVQRIVYRPLGIDSLTTLAFEIPSSSQVDALRAHLLQDANTDEDLYLIALAAQAGKGETWLGSVIEDDLKASRIHRVARGLTLVGFLDEGILLERSRSELGGKVGFLNDVAAHAVARLERNARARTWFTQFLTRGDPVEAWAAFRLFLRCTDRRFYLWEDKLLASVDNPPLLWQQHLSANKQEISRAASENEGKLSDTLFGFRIAKGEMVPWYRTPESALAART